MVLAVADIDLRASLAGDARDETGEPLAFTVFAKSPQLHGCLLVLLFLQRDVKHLPCMQGEDGRGQRTGWGRERADR